MSQYDDDAGLLGDECEGCGQPNYACVCTGAPECLECGGIGTIEEDGNTPEHTCPVCHGSGYEEILEDDDDAT